MVLLDDIVEVLHASECAVLWENFLFLRCGESVRIRGMFVDTDCERKSSVISPHHLLKEAFCRGNIALCASHEFNRIAFFIHCAIEVLHPVLIFM
jgi:hypothetical protein